MASAPRFVNPTNRIAAAEQQALQAERDIASSSATRLAELMKRSPRERHRAIDDNALSPSDREQLRHTVEAALPWRPSFRLPMPRVIRLRRAASKTVRRAVSVPGMIAVSVGGVWLALTIVNTRPLAKIVESGMSTLTLRAGTTVVEKVWPGVVAPILSESKDEIVLGVWENQAGYRPLRVPKSAVRAYP